MIVYGIVASGGFFHARSVVGLLNLKTADNFLHLAIAAPSAYDGFRHSPVVEMRR